MTATRMPSKQRRRKLSPSSVSPSSLLLDLLKQIDGNLEDLRLILSRGLASIPQEIPEAKAVPVHSLPHPQLRLVAPPLYVTLNTNLEGSRWQAELPELDLVANAATPARAVMLLLPKLVKLYEKHSARSSETNKRWTHLRQIIAPFEPSPNPNSGSAPASPLPATGVPTFAPTFAAWAKAHAPRPFPRAWIAGAGARLRQARGLSVPRSRYRTEPHLQLWRDGHQAVADYLSAGGLFFCPACSQPLALPALQREVSS